MHTATAIPTAQGKYVTQPGAPPMAHPVGQPTAQPMAVARPMAQPLLCHTTVQVAPVAAVVPIVAEEPSTECLKWAAVILGLFGLVQALSIAGILALCVLCKVGCCSGSSRLIHSRASSIKCTAIACAIFAFLQIGGSVVVTNTLTQLCGIFVEDSTDNLQAAAYDAGLAAMKVGEKAWEYDNPDAAEPAIATGTSNKMAWALSYPSSVCDYMPSITAAGSNGIYYPHPFASFGNDIKNYLIAVNGATGALAILVAVLAGNLRSSVRAVTYAQYP